MQSVSELGVMIFTRRNALLGSLAASAIPAIGCSAAPSGAARTNLTHVHVMGVIHSNHRRSDKYSLDVLEAAIRKADPDVILTEIPPDRVEQAIASFRETGAVDEPRTRVFPEYTDVVLPLSLKMGFRILGTAGWTQKIADDRRAALEAIENDPERAAQWAEHRPAVREYSRRIAGRGDDPLFIHTDEFDALVEASRTPYQRNFDTDLGAGGWTQINRAHTNLINNALDLISGQGLKVLITFGTAHKYLIRRSLEMREDVELLDTAALFA